MKIEKVRELHGDEFGQKITEVRTQLFKLRIQKAIGQEANPMKVRNLRKDVARMKTVQAELARKKE
jgi:large subunit ribosomal protein L29